MTSISGIQSQLSDLGLISPARSIGPYDTDSFTLPTGINQFSAFTAQVTVEEVSIDELEITRHPVEQGAAITDHAFKKPSQLILRLGWSNSSLSSVVNDITQLAALAGGNTSGTFNYVRTIYDKLLAIQASCVPIKIVTGKRKYSNMLIRSLTAPTTSQSENALFVTMMCEQIIVVQTQAVTYPDSSVQADPSSTGAVQDTGSAQPQITAFMLNDNGTVGQQIDLHAGGS